MTLVGMTASLLCFGLARFHRWGVLQQYFFMGASRVLIWSLKNPATNSRKKFPYDTNVYFFGMEILIAIEVTKAAAGLQQQQLHIIEAALSQKDKRNFSVAKVILCALCQSTQLWQAFSLSFESYWLVMKNSFSLLLTLHDFSLSSICGNVSTAIRELQLWGV